MKMSQDRKLRFLAQYMDDYIDSWPKKIKPFERWLDSTLQKRINKGNHEIKQQQLSICRYCRSRFKENGLIKTKDHIVPLSKGGFDKAENRVPCCYDCNQWKSDKLPSEWLSEINKLIKKQKTHGNYSHQKLAIMVKNIRDIVNWVNDNIKKVSLYRV